MLPKNKSTEDIVDEQADNKQEQKDNDEELAEICSVDDLFNSYVACAVIIDIRSSKEYLTSHIYESINIDPSTVDKPNKHINQSKYGRHIAIYGSKDIIKNYMNIIQFIMNQFTPKSIKILNDGYDIFKQHYPFICAANGCDAYMYPSVIIPNKVYLGRQKTRFAQKALMDLKITHIVDVTATNLINHGDAIKVLKIALQDSDDTNIDKYFDEAIEFIDKAFDDDNNNNNNNNDSRVFVHCQMGISRSSTIILAWLMKSKGYTLVDAYKLCQKCRPCIHPNDGFFDQLIKYETEIYGKTTKHDINALKLRETNECIVMLSTANMSYYNWLLLVLISLILTINNVVLCSFNCEKKHCCLPKSLPGNTASFNMNCNTLGLEDCVLNNDICEWDCTPSHTAKTKRGLLRAGYTKQSFKKISKGDGEYMEPKFIGTEPPNSLHGEPETVEEVIKYTQIMSVDECGIVYQYEMDAVSANVELNRIKNRKKRKRNSKNKDRKSKGNANSKRNIGKSDDFNTNQDLDDTIRRLTVFGDDTRIQITNPSQMQFSGYLQFTTALGVEKRCSASLIGPDWIITAAHCVHSGRGPFGGEWYSNWRFYPGLTAADQMESLEIHSLRAWTFGEWANSFAPNWNYDIGWIQLNISTIDTGIPYLKIAYDDTITHGTNFQIVGYPGDQQFLTKWYQLCSWTFVTANIMFTNKCDITGGSSGSPVYKISSNTLQTEILCIVSWENSAYNGCARITQSKYDSICSFMGCDDDDDDVATIPPTIQPVVIQPAL